MNAMIKKLGFTAFLLLSMLSVFAQQDVEMADMMRSNGKIYAVVAVCLLILVGLFAYVWSVDRKISRLEKDGNDN